jgi:hypothetical protein
MKRLLSMIALAFVPVLAIDVEAQARDTRRATASARADAPIDLTGQWVAIISEDWRWRMITPPKGDIVSIPLSLQGQQTAEAWDPAKDEGCRRTVQGLRGTGLDAGANPHADLLAG